MAKLLVEPPAVACTESYIAACQDVLTNSRYCQGAAYYCVFAVKK